MSLKSTGAEGNRQFIEKENMAGCCAMRKKKNCAFYGNFSF